MKEAPPDTAAGRADTPFSRPTRDFLDRHGTGAREYGAGAHRYVTGACDYGAGAREYGAGACEHCTGARRYGSGNPRAGFCRGVTAPVRGIILTAAAPRRSISPSHPRVFRSLSPMWWLISLKADRAEGRHHRASWRNGRLFYCAVIGTIVTLEQRVIY